MAFLYVPNGKNMADWTPKAEGRDLASCRPSCEPLAGLKDDFSILTGLTADKARAHGDGGGDHARALSAFLTGCQPRKTDGADIRAGVSVDQVAAARVGDQTRLPSLEIGCEAGADGRQLRLAATPASTRPPCPGGRRRSRCRRRSTRSWSSSACSAPARTPTRAKRDAARKSVLDFVREDTADLKGKLGATDQRKLDEYFAAVRDIEQRIARAEKLPPVKTPEYEVAGHRPGELRGAPAS